MENNIVYKSPQFSYSVYKVKIRGESYWHFSILIACFPTYYQMVCKPKEKGFKTKKAAILTVKHIITQRLQIQLNFGHTDKMVRDNLKKLYHTPLFASGYMETLNFKKIENELAE